jgi:hypothetical protein
LSLVQGSAGDARVARSWLGAIAALALALRLPGYLGWWFNPDEAIYLEVATASAERARAMVENNAHPPLQYALLRWIAPWSTSPLALRLPSLVAGVALVPLLFAAVRRLAGVRAGLAAALLIALSPSAVVLSGVMRPYALQQAALALALFGWAGWLAGEGRTRLALFAGGLCLALGLHYSSFAALAAFGAALVALAAARRLAPRRALELGLAGLVPAVAAAWLYVAHIAANLEGGGLQAEAREGWLKAQFAQGPSAALGRVSRLFEGLFGFEELALALALAALVLGARVRRWETLALPALALGAALALSYLGKYPLGGSRHSAWLLVFLAPLVAEGFAGLAAVRSPRVRTVAFLVALALAVGAGREAVRLSRGRAHGEFLPEGAVRPAEARAVADALESGLPADAVLVTDHQTLNLLRAALDADAARLRRKGDAGLARALLGGREFLYPPFDPQRPASIPWELPWQRSRAAEHVHVARVLEQIDARPALAERAAAHGVWLALGGWSPPPAPPPPRRDAAAPPLFEQSIGGPGLGLFRLDRAAYAAYLAGN